MIGSGSPALVAGVGIDRAGQLTVSWGVRRQLVARRFTGSGWSSEIEISPAEAVLGEMSLRSKDELTILVWAGYYAPTFEPRLHATVWSSSGRTDSILATSPEDLDSVALDVLGRSALVSWSQAHGWRDLHGSRFEDGGWSALGTLSPDGFSAVVGFDETNIETVWWLDSFGQSLSSSHEVANGWSEATTTALDPMQPSRFVVHASNGAGRSVLLTTRGSTLVARRSEADAGVVDLVDGLFLPRLTLPRLSVGPSGARWLLAPVLDSNSQYTLGLAFVCP